MEHDRENETAAVKADVRVVVTAKGAVAEMAESERAAAALRRANDVAMVLERDADAIAERIAGRLTAAMPETAPLAVSLAFAAAEPTFVASARSDQSLLAAERRALAEHLPDAVKAECAASIAQAATPAGFWEASVDVALPAAQPPASGATAASAAPARATGPDPRSTIWIWLLLVIVIGLVAAAYVLNR